MPGLLIGYGIYRWYADDGYEILRFESWLNYKWEELLYTYVCTYLLLSKLHTYFLVQIKFEFVVYLDSGKVHRYVLDFDLISFLVIEFSLICVISLLKIQMKLYFKLNLHYLVWSLGVDLKEVVTEIIT